MSPTEAVMLLSKGRVSGEPSGVTSVLNTWEDALVLRALPLNTGAQ